MSSVRPGVDSPGETRTRLAIVDAGLPETDVRIELWDDGVGVVRGDLGYRRWLIWVELAQALGAAPARIAALPAGLSPEADVAREALVA